MREGEKQRKVEGRSKRGKKEKKGGGTGKRNMFIPQSEAMPLLTNEEYSTDVIYYVFTIYHKDTRTHTHTHGEREIDR